MKANQVARESDATERRTGVRPRVPFLLIPALSLYLGVLALADLPRFGWPHGGFMLASLLLAASIFSYLRTRLTVAICLHSASAACALLLISFAETYGDMYIVLPVVLVPTVGILISLKVLSRQPTKLLFRPLLSVLFAAVALGVVIIHLAVQAHSGAIISGGYAVFVRHPWQSVRALSAALFLVIGFLQIIVTTRGALRSPGITRRTQATAETRA